ncbi:hypothetical protein [Mycolicibacterium vinylchloridicum]|uniref:hypothetical protein n=1 Tax=Mycolicibacterium vinylchloridicum TaxID=2736928 RepID=UPI0015CAC4F7|nr:hypothetical protein [Mycolicibacterium vinylchloridicum]
MTSIKCNQKALQGDYVDHILVYLETINTSGDRVGTPRAIVIGAPKPMGFKPSVEATFDDKMTLSVDGGPAQQWEPGLTTVYEPVPHSDSHSLRVTVVNVRGVDDPYKLAKALLLVGSAAAAAAASAALYKALGALFAAEKGSDILDLTKKIVAGGGGGLVEAGIEYLAGLLTDIFDDWPDCSGTVLDGTISFQEPGGTNFTLKTELDREFPKGCNQPSYEAELYVHFDDTLPPVKPVKWDCRYRPHTNVNVRTFTPWWRSREGTRTTSYAVIDHSLEGTPIKVFIEPTQDGTLDVHVIEKSRDGKGNVLDQTVSGVKPQLAGVRMNSPIAVRLKPDPGEDEGSRRPLGLTHQVDTTEVKLKRGQLPWWQAPMLRVQNPDRFVSRITLPDIDVQMDLYERFCTAKDDAGHDRYQTETVIYYRRGGRTARQAQGNPGYTVSTATLVVTTRAPG